MKKYILMTALCFPAIICAKGSDDYDAFNTSACMIAVDDAKSYKQINVNYIRLIKIEKEMPTIVQISMASNYYNSETDKFRIKYNTKKEARDAVAILANRITNCRKNSIN